MDLLESLSASRCELQVVPNDKIGDVIFVLSSNFLFSFNQSIERLSVSWYGRLFV